MPTASSSIFSKRSETIRYSSSNIASIFSTAGNYTKPGRISWRRDSKDLMLTVSKQQYAPPMRSPHPSQVILLVDGHLIVVGPEEVNRWASIYDKVSYVSNRLRRVNI